MSGLENMKKAARLIEEMTGCRFKHGIIGESFIYHDTNRFLSVNMRWEWDAGARLFHYRFETELIPKREPLSAADMATLRQEAAQTEALLIALSMRDYTLTPEDRHAFEDFIGEMTEQREEQEQSTGPVMGQQQL
jgi:hypothetical protein